MEGGGWKEGDGRGERQGIAREWKKEVEPENDGGRGVGGDGWRKGTVGNGMGNSRECQGNGRREWQTGTAAHAHRGYCEPSPAM